MQWFLQFVQKDNVNAHVTTYVYRNVKGSTGGKIIFITEGWCFFIVVKQPQKARSRKYIPVVSNLLKAVDEDLRIDTKIDMQVPPLDT